MGLWGHRDGAAQPLQFWSRAFEDDYFGAEAPLARRLRQLSRGERREEAAAFLDLYGRETGQGAKAVAARKAAVDRDLRRHNHYEHTPEELAFGARVAWRNHGRCIGRRFWQGLEVYDCREVSDPDQIAARLADHMSHALSGGHIRSVISIFAPVRGNRLPVHVESPQLTSYAGYLAADGTVTGDRQNVDLTRTIRSLGYRLPDPPGHFDRLPIVIRDTQDRRILYDLPGDTLREVAIAHADHPGLAALGLRWYAVPCVSDMILSIGGIDYPCAPFNGFYMGTEIASRDFADVKRYNLLPRVAEALGEAPQGSDPFWRDRCLTVLNEAVVQSYAKAGVTLVDHHTASDQFIDFHRAEQAAGRRVAADWAWVVPPQASAGCRVFHMPMEDHHPVPNFYRNRVDDGRDLMPFYGDIYRSRMARNTDRVRRLLKHWRRLPW